MKTIHYNKNTVSSEGRFLFLRVRRINQGTESHGSRLRRDGRVAEVGKGKKTGLSVAKFLKRGVRFFLKRLFFTILHTLEIAFLVNVLVFWDVQTAWGYTVAFNTAGSTTWVVPSGVTSITVKAWGAGGGGGGGGAFTTGNGAGAGFALATLTVTPGETLNIFVGGGGGGSSYTTGTGTSSSSGSLQNAGNNTDVDYAGNAGRGGNGGTSTPTAL